MMKNMGQFMKQAQKMQEDMAAMQEKLGQSEVSGQSGAGLVRITVNGKGDVKSVHLDPEILKEEVDLVQDLIVAAFRDAKQKLDSFVSDEMKSITGGLPKGLNFPF